ncbi:hypothetical protein J6590_067967 [Homalodisca vitripennis]|nr:hypothetical protein J6590_067967 [Homalodisca vitripennis]
MAGCKSSWEVTFPQVVAAVAVVTSRGHIALKSKGQRRMMNFRFNQPIISPANLHLTIRMKDQVHCYSSMVLNMIYLEERVQRRHVTEVFAAMLREARYSRPITSMNNEVSITNNFGVGDIRREICFT